MVFHKNGSARTRVLPLFSGGTSIQVGEHDSEISLIHKEIASVTAAGHRVRNMLYCDFHKFVTCSEKRDHSG